MTDTALFDLLLPRPVEHPPINRQTVRAADSDPSKKRTSKPIRPGEQSQRVLDLLREHGGMTSSELGFALNESCGAMHHCLKRLKADGRVRIIGMCGRVGVWGLA